MNLLNIVTLLPLRVVIWISPYQNHNNIDYLQLENFRINPHRDKNLVVPTICRLSKQTLSQLIHQRFGHVSITQLKLMTRKGLMEGLPENLPELEEPCPICLLTKASKTSTDVSKFAPEFMLQMDFAFFNIESIRGFTSTFVDICSATSYPFGLPSKSKRPPLDILKFLVTTLRNQDEKFAFIRVDEDCALARSSELMSTCHNMNIIVQTTGGYASSLNGKSESPNNTLANITRALLLNSSHNK